MLAQPPMGGSASLGTILAGGSGLWKNIIRVHSVHGGGYFSEHVQCQAVYLAYLLVTAELPGQYLIDLVLGPDAVDQQA